MNNDLCIIRGDCSSTSGESQITPAVLQMNIHKNPASLRVILDSRIGWATVPGAPKLFTTAPVVIPYQLAETTVTPKAGRNSLLGSYTLLKLTLRSLHSTSS
jgi:hypothetical protein